MIRGTDHYRQAGMTAGLDYLDAHQTNAIAKQYMIGALLAALSAFETEWLLDAESRQGYALVLAGTPVVVLPTMSMARHQRRQLARLLEVGRLTIKIIEVEYVV